MLSQNSLSTNKTEASFVNLESAPPRQGNPLRVVSITPPLIHKPSRQASNGGFDFMEFMRLRGFSQEQDRQPTAPCQNEMPLIMPHGPLAPNYEMGASYYNSVSSLTLDPVMNSHLITPPPKPSSIKSVSSSLKKNKKKKKFPGCFSSLAISTPSVESSSSSILKSDTSPPFPISGYIKEKETLRNWKEERELQNQRIRARNAQKLGYALFENRDGFKGLKDVRAREAWDRELKTGMRERIEEWLGECEREGALGFPEAEVGLGRGFGERDIAGDGLVGVEDEVETVEFEWRE